ncbi:MAG TPA: hypothetical protein DCO79_00605 [Spirochaeta sp.]|nr:hypothetical protein [Spirochaeta sp.]
MKIVPFHDSFNAIRTQLNELNQKLESSDIDDVTSGLNKKEFLNSIILESMNESEREKEQILNSLVEQVCYMDLDYNIKWINDAGLRNISSDISVNDILGKPCHKIWHGLNQPCESCPVATTLKTGWPNKEEITYPDGRTMLVSSQPVIDDNDSIMGIIEVLLDITMRKDAERALEKSKQRAQALLDVIPDLLLIFNESGSIIDYHPAPEFDILTNIEYPQGKHLSEVMSTDLASAIFKNSKTLEGPGFSRNFEFNNQTGSDEQFYNCRLIKTTDTENVCIIRDISLQKNREREILHKSFHDKLTGLYNRAYFDEELKRINHSRESLPTSILIIDVNSLKLTNDAFGHDFGDRLLQVVADILQTNSRKSDVIARTGGDEFSIILPGSPLAKAERLSDRIRAACRERDFEDIFARPSVSIGTAERIDNSVSLQDVIKLADERMYEMKLEKRKEHLNILIKDILISMKTHGLQTKEHTDSCIRLSGEFASSRDLSRDSIDKIKNLALLHDIGNIRISSQILSKSGKLSPDEYSEVRQHAIIGFRIAKAIPDYASIADLILYHHERWDGQGYPSGLKGKEVPLLNRIFSIVDTYDLLHSGTPYKNAVSREEALNEIHENKGKQFDPDLADNFIQYIKDENL